MEALVHALLLEKEYVEFLVGRDGDLDQIVSSAVKRQKRLVRDDNSSLVWILPYPTAELRNKRCLRAVGKLAVFPSGREYLFSIGGAAVFHISHSGK